MPLSGSPCSTPCWTSFVMSRTTSEGRAQAIEYGISTLVIPADGWYGLFASHRVGVVQSPPGRETGRRGTLAREGEVSPVAGVEERNGAVIVRLAGELDLYNAHALRDELVAAAEREPERLVVDLSGLTFIDSTGLGVLIEARTR